MKYRSRGEKEGSLRRYIPPDSGKVVAVLAQHLNRCFDASNRALYKRGTTVK